MTARRLSGDARSALYKPSSRTHQEARPLPHTGSYPCACPTIRILRGGPPSPRSRSIRSTTGPEETTTSKWHRATVRRDRHALESRLVDEPHVRRHLEITEFNDKTWLNFNGTMRTDELYTLERISRPNRDTLHYEATIIDPGAYVEPWTVSWDIPWLAGAELAEYICQENNQFLIDLKDDFGNPFFEDVPTLEP